MTMYVIKERDRDRKRDEQTDRQTETETEVGTECRRPTAIQSIAASF